jgi:short-subunit dehydrogenase
LLYRTDEYRVIVTARRASLDFLRRQFQESERFRVRELDVTDARQRERLVAEIERDWAGVNILVNNAGIAYRAVIEHMTEEDEQVQMATNYFGPAALIRRTLREMRSLGRGKIINVSSVSGMLAMPTMSAYSASKHALEGLSEALWYEARPLGISVTLIQPGFIHSRSFRRVRYTSLSHPDAQSQPGDENQKPYSDYYHHMTPFIERLMTLSRATSESVAKLILKTIRTENPPLWIPATFDARLFYFFHRFIPRRLLHPILFLALPGARHWARQYTKSRACRPQARAG